MTNRFYDDLIKLGIVNLVLMELKMEKRKDVITFQGNPLTLVGNEIKVGDKAPEFTVLNNSLSPVKLGDFKGKVKVISVVPSVDTPVCAIQTKRFNKMASDFNDVQIVTISNDLPFALARFCGAEGIENSETLSDYNGHDFGTKYGFLIDELKLLSRGVIIIDRDDTVKYVQYVKEVTNEPDYDSAFSALEKVI